MKKRSPRKIAGAVLFSLALLFSVPIVDYVRAPHGDWLYPLGFEPFNAIPPLAWVLAIVIGAGIGWFTIRSFQAVAVTWSEISWLKLISIAAAAGAAIVEEAFFRHVIMDAIAESGGGAVIQVAVSAVAFGLAHAVWGLIRLDGKVAFSSAVATTLMGIGFAIVYLAGDRALAPCILSHFIVTGVIEPGLMISAVTGQWDRPRTSGSSQPPVPPDARGTLD